MSGTRDLPVQHPAPDDWFSGIGEEGESEWLTEEPQIQNEDWSLPAAMQPLSQATRALSTRR